MRRHQVRKKQQLEKAMMLCQTQDNENGSEKKYSNQSNELLASLSRTFRDKHHHQLGQNVHFQDKHDSSSCEDINRRHNNNSTILSNEANSMLKTMSSTKFANHQQHHQQNSLSHHVPTQMIHQMKNISLSNDVNKQKQSVDLSSPPSTPPSTSSTSTSSHDTELRPEILFLVRKHAEAIDRINKLEKRIEQIELSKSNVSSPETSVKCNVMSPEVSHSRTNQISCKERNTTSDDSGGEYSRATISDDDELSSLLDQIAKYSKQIHQNQRQVNQQSCMSQSILPRQSMVHQITPMYSLPAVEKSTSNFTQQPRRRLQSQHAIKPLQPSQPLQSLSALLFDPNVNNVLDHLDQLIDDQIPIASNAFSRSLSQQTSIYDEIGLPSGGKSTQGALNSDSNSQSTNWEIEKLKSMIKEKEKQEFESQMRLSQQWLANQLGSEPGDPPQRQAHYIDSLEPSTFR